MFSTSHAQTNGTWIGGSGSWSTGPWTSSPAFPDNGGVATFRPIPTEGAYAEIHPDRIVTLSKMHFDTVYYCDVGVIDVITGATDVPSFQFTPDAEVRVDRALKISFHLYYLFDLTLGAITGSNGFSKTGPGALELYGPSDFVGDVRIREGRLSINGAAGSMPLGAANNRVVLDGGELADSKNPNHTNPELVLTHPVFVDTGGGRIGSTRITRSRVFQIAAPISGAGPLSITPRSGSNTIALTSANPFTGPTTIDGSGTALLSAAGSLKNSSSININRGTLTVNYAATTAGVVDADRLGNAAPITMRGGQLSMLGNATLSVSETIGPMSISGRTKFAASPGSSDAGAPTIDVVAPSLTRTDRGTIQFSLVPNKSSIHFAQAPALVGGGGATGSQNISIIPHAVAVVGESSLSFVTYDSSGIRPLTESEYVMSVPSAAGPFDRNLLVINNDMTVNAPTTVNALRMFDNRSLFGSSTLTVSSGAVITGMEPTRNFSGQTFTHRGAVFCPLNFGSNEAIIAGGGTLSGSMHGTGGLTAHGGDFYVSSTSSTYTGQTLVQDASLTIRANVPASGPGPLGSDTSAVRVKNGGLLMGTPNVPGTFTFARPIVIDAPSEENQVQIGGAWNTTAGSQPNVTFTGDITAAGGEVYLTGNGTTTFTGTLSGAAAFVTYPGGPSGEVILTGNNTFTGGVEAAFGTKVLRAGSDTAFGTGSINVSSGSIGAFNGARTLANPLDIMTGGAIAAGPAVTFTGPVHVDMETNLRSLSTNDVTFTNSMDGGSLTFNGTGGGGLHLAGANPEFLGVMTVQAGPLYVENSQALGVPQLGTVVNAIGSINLAAGVSIAQESLAITSANQTAASGNPAPQFRALGNGNSAWNGPITFTGGDAVIGVDANGTMSLANVTLAAGKSLAKVGPGTLIMPRVSPQEINVAGGTLRFASSVPSNQSAKTFRVTLGSASSTLDLSDNDLHITGGNTLAEVEAKVRAAYNFGNWDGAGISSSTARDNPIGNTTLGVMSGQQFIENSGGNVFDGNTVNATDVLVKYTYFGDVDFNGSIDASDYNLIDFGFVNHLTGWANGDADYSGSVDVSDYNLIDFAFATQNGTILRAMQYLDGTDRSTRSMNDDPSLQEVMTHFEQFGESYASGFLAAVPEPTCVGVLAIAALTPRRRRRRHHS